MLNGYEFFGNGIDRFPFAHDVLHCLFDAGKFPVFFLNLFERGVMKSQEITMENQFDL